MKSFVVFLTVVAVICGSLWFFAIGPMVAENEFQREVNSYLEEIEGPITDSAFSWINCERQFGFPESMEHRRCELINRLSVLSSGGYTQFSTYSRDSWVRAHRDVLDEAACCARVHAEKALDVDMNRVRFDVFKNYFPKGWEKRLALEKLHYKIARYWSPKGQTIAERKTEFDALRVQIDELMDELKIKKKEVTNNR